eukprot:3197485-Ditylum_brightwellii.AAC.1
MEDIIKVDTVKEDIIRVETKTMAVDFSMKEDITSPIPKVVDFKTEADMAETREIQTLPSIV